MGSSSSSRTSRPTPGASSDSPPSPDDVVVPLRRRRGRGTETAREQGRALVAPDDDVLAARVRAARPVRREDCRHGPRPCLFVSCRHHLFLDVNERSGSIRYSFPGARPDEIPETCALDVAEHGGLTLEEIGRMLNLTRERVRQLERGALAKILLVLDGLE